MLTIRDMRFRSTALNLLEPNVSAAGTVTVITEPSTVSVYSIQPQTIIANARNNTSANHQVLYTLY